MSIIAISRGTKSGGMELANGLSRRLGYKILSREEVVSESGKKFNIMEEFLQVQLDRTPSLWQRFTHEYERYICFIQCALLQAIKQDNVIYHGHAGQFLLKELPSVLKLRIEAPLEYRARSVMAEFDYTRDEAVSYIKKVDDERKRWVKMVYNQDWCDPALYDMCMNLQNMSMDNICDVVERVVAHEDFRTSENSIQRLNNMALQCEVNAALSADDRIWRSGHRVTVNAHNGVVSLQGTTRTGEMRDLIVETASRVTSVVDCKSEVTLLSDALNP